MPTIRIFVSVFNHTHARTSHMQYTGRQVDLLFMSACKTHARFNFIFNEKSIDFVIDAFITQRSVLAREYVWRKTSHRQNEM